MGTKKNEPAGGAKPARATAPARAKASAGAKAPAGAKRSTAKRKQATPSHEEIATRAYFIALEAGTADHLDHWLKAEDELTTG